MTKTLTILTILAIGITIGSLTATVLPQLPTAFAQAGTDSGSSEPEESESGSSETEGTTVAGTVPDWFRGVAGFWADDKLSTAEFLDGIEFLITEGIITVPSTSAAAVDETEIEDI